MTEKTFNIFDRDENLVVATRKELEAIVEGMYWSQIKADLDKKDTGWITQYLHGKAPNISAMSDDALLREFWGFEGNGTYPILEEDLSLPRAPHDAEPDVPPEEDDELTAAVPGRG